MRIIAGISALLFLAACLPGGGASKEPAANPITGSAIEVTALDAPAPAPAASAATQPSPDMPPAESTALKPKAKPAELPEAATVAPDGAAPVAAPAVPEVLKTATQLACEKRGDVWVKAGSSSAHTCVKRTKDAGKRCTNGTQCQGECLARSNTCAPYQPLFGCNEVVQDNGVRMTLCLD
ncbi:hypothetical protein Q9295_04700 [Xinfangfangia sp. CPCC 101601]|uniref:Uncharacterized protein n=1 Tax=Pseudogemmobacter lacusdianii TaxID=3069608 RepID=A0ABU0VV93_9RHOB|nr:hypothetical protein [Xinfangfangia sp. CPCC 101601]MDQ2065660.1 hypothetical protein [Xinfangfangia sp. CPCC 101601]